MLCQKNPSDVRCKRFLPNAANITPTCCKLQMTKVTHNTPGLGMHPRQPVSCVPAVAGVDIDMLPTARRAIVGLLHVAECMAAGLPDNVCC